MINYIFGTIRTWNNSLLTALATRNAEFLPLQRQAWGKGDLEAQDPKPTILEYHTWHTFHFYIKCLRVQRVFHSAFPTICRMGTHQSISNCKWITLQNPYMTTYNHVHFEDVEWKGFKMSCLEHSGNFQPQHTQHTFIIPVLIHRMKTSYLFWSQDYHHEPNLHSVRPHWANLFFSQLTFGVHWGLPFPNAELWRFTELSLERCTCLLLKDKLMAYYWPLYLFPYLLMSTGHIFSTVIVICSDKIQVP